MTWPISVAQPANPAGRRLHLLVQRCAHVPTNLGKDAQRLKLSAKKVCFTPPLAPAPQAARALESTINSRTLNFRFAQGHRSLVLVIVIVILISGRFDPAPPR